MKKLFMVPVALSFLLCSTCIFAQPHLQSGSFTVNHSTANYTLDQNTGDRSVSIDISFDKPFDKKPSVIAAVSMIEGDTKSLIRFNVSASSISRDGFTLNISTWGDSKILTIGGTWLAYSE